MTTSSNTAGFPRLAVVLLATAAAVIAIAGIRSFSGIAGPVFLALVLTVAVHPVQSYVLRRGAPVWVGTIAALVTVYVVIVLLFAALAVSVALVATELPSYIGSGDDLVAKIHRALTAVGVSDEQARNALTNINLGSIAGFIASALEQLSAAISNLFFVLTLLFFMGVDGATMTQRMALIRQQRPAIADALSSFAQRTQSYLIVSTVFGGMVAVLDGAALWLLGVPLPLAWAVLSFVTNYIPNIGFAIGLIPPALLALLESGPVLMLWVIVVYSVLNFIIQSMIQPKFVGDAVGLSVTASFLALAFWAWVLGPLGALLAIPATLLVKALLIDIDPSTRWVNALLGSGEVPVGVGPDPGDRAGDGDSDRPQGDDG